MLSPSLPLPLILSPFLFPLFLLPAPIGLSVSGSLSFEMVQVAGSGLALDKRGNSFTKYHLTVLLSHGGILRCSNPKP